MSNIKNPKYKKYKGFIPDGGSINCAIDIYKKQGYLGFCRGFSAVSFRAVLANGVMFYFYEIASKFLDVREGH